MLIYKKTKDLGKAEMNDLLHSLKSLGVSVSMDHSFIADRHVSSCVSVEVHN
jgi:hypothetical protein